MPTYVYEARDGSRVEEVFSMTNYPKRIKRNGKVYALTLSGGGGVRCKNYAHRADALPRWIPGAPDYVRTPGQHYGKALFNTRQQVQEVIAQSDGKLSYGEGHDFE